MYLKKMVVKEFIENIDSVWEEVDENYKSLFGYSASPSEIGSWKNSYPFVAEMLQKSNEAVKNSTIFMEYGMPGSSARADIVLVGLDKNQNRVAIVLELKQWDLKSIVTDGINLKVGGILHNHPSDQALSYCDFLQELSPAFSHSETTIIGCSYLFNAKIKSVEKIKEKQFSELTEQSPIFSGDEIQDLANWINSIIIAKPDLEFLSDLDNDQPAISKNLFNTIAKAIREEESWILLDEQKIAYNLIKDKILNPIGQKQLILITGGPGTGKSVIAAQLVGELARKEIPVVHVTNSSSFTTVMRAIINKHRDKKWGSAALKSLFRLSHNWVKRKDKFNTAICDEAHRFRSKTTFTFLRSPRPQAEEIMECVDTFVAFIDEKQRLRVAEEGTVRNFTKWALNSGIHQENIHGPLELKVQFRCAGNEDFVKVLDAALYDEVAVGFSHHNFDVNIHDSMDDLEKFLELKIGEGKSSRIVAGFCWDWSDPDEENNLVNDVTIGNWEKPWNRKPTGKENSINHPYTIWANRTENQLAEIGCIYSVQGFEFDYIGVIWGNDLVYRGNKWVAQPAQSFDSDYKRRGIAKEEILLLIKNAYRVLLSRGLKGCSIYCLDKETREFLKEALMHASSLDEIQSALQMNIT